MRLAIFLAMVGGSAAAEPSRLAMWMMCYPATIDLMVFQEVDLTEKNIVRSVKASGEVPTDDESCNELEKK